MLSNEEIERLRKETKGTAEVIHFNNAGSALPSDRVRQATIDYLEEEMTRGGYETREKYAADFEQAYASIARFLNAEATEIAIMENATVAWHAGFHGIDWKDGDEVLISHADYSSHYLTYLHLKREKDIQIKMVPNDAQGQIDLAALESMIGPRSRVIALAHIPTSGGLVNPAQEVGAIAKKHGLIYILDACQSAGQVPLDVQALGCNILSAAGRKYVRGPRGTGFLYVSKQIMDQLTPSVIDLHSAEWTSTNTYRFRNDARRFETWENNYAGIYGLKVAVEYAMEIDMDRIWQRVEQLGEILRSSLQTLPGVVVHDTGVVRCGIVTFSMEGQSAPALKDFLKNHHVNVSWTNAANARLDLGKRGVEEVVRSSVHYYNTKDEIEQFVALLAGLKQ